MMMTAPSFTDSQVSELYGPEELAEINAHVDLDNLPILEDEVMAVHEKKFIVENPVILNSQMPIERLPYGKVGNIPIREEFPGPYNFEFFLNCQGKGKSYVYSSSLRKIFIDMEQKLPIRFKWDPPYDRFWLRAMVVYTDDQHQSSPVARCHNHLAMNSPSNINVSDNVLKHVIRCDHPHSFYEETNGHLSVVVPLGAPQPGVPYVPLDFQFYCKNSCSSGMNRRATEIVFTLERDNCEVVGRRALSCRVCSCPKRDKEKEEIESQEIRVMGGRKRKIAAVRQGPPVPPGKKLLLSTMKDSQEYSITLKIPGIENARTILRASYDVLAGEAIRNGEFQRMLPYLEDLQKKLSNIP